MALAVESVPMFDTAESRESELEDLYKRYRAIRDSGLDESHPRVQFVVTEFRRALTRYEKAAA